MTEHIVRRATEIEGKQDCCGDRYRCDVVWVCSCGLHLCDGHMKSHIFEFHIMKQLDLGI